MPKHAGGAFQELVFPDRDLVRMNIKQLRQLRQCLVAFDRSQSNLRLNAGECVRRLFFVIFAPDSQQESSPLSGRKSTQATVRICGASSLLSSTLVPSGSVIRRPGEAVV